MKGSGAWPGPVKTQLRTHPMLTDFCSLLRTAITSPSVVACRCSTGPVTDLVRISETFESPGILRIRNFPSATMSCTQRYRVSTCLCFPRPFLEQKAPAALESDSSVIVSSKPKSRKNDCIPKL